MRIPYQEKDFFTLLEETGNFNQLELDVLDALFTLKKDGKEEVTAREISKEAGMSVTNAYKYLYSLKEKGLVEFRTGSKGKNKVFWLAESTNPFPRMFSLIGKEFLKKKHMFERLEYLYRNYVQGGSVWKGHKIRETFVGNIEEKMAYLFDIAQKEILIATKKFNNDFVVMDALKRALSRGVKVRIITEIADQKFVQKMKSAGIPVKMCFGHSNVVIVDSKHGLKINLDGTGEIFLNYNTDYKARFEELWENADSL